MIIELFIFFLDEDVKLYFNDFNNLNMIILELICVIMWLLMYGVSIMFVYIFW